MKCEICHQNDAEQPIVVTENGVNKELYVCKTCASQQKVGHIGKISMADILFDFSSTQQKKEENTPPKIDQVCPTCGTSFAKIHSDHRAGCPDCYLAFEEQMDRMIAVYNAADFELIKQEMMDLDQKLIAAISEERFEDAAVIRDLINSKAKAKTLNPLVNKKQKPPMPPEILEAMKKMGISIDIISNDQNLDDNDDEDEQEDDPF